MRVYDLYIFSICEYLAARDVVETIDMSLPRLLENISVPPARADRPGRYREQWPAALGGCHL
jgi:hypothetical protein